MATGYGVVKSKKSKGAGGERGLQLRMGSRNAIESYIRNLYAGHAGSTVSTEDLNGQADWQTGRRRSKRQVVGEVALEHQHNRLEVFKYDVRFSGIVACDDGSGVSHSQA